MSDLFKQFLTQEEEDRRKEIFDILDVDEFAGYADNEKFKLISQLDKELADIATNVYMRYLKSRDNDINNILQDMYATIDQVTIEEYEKHLEIEKYHFDFLQDRTHTENLSKEVIETWRTWTNKNLRSFMYFVNEKKLRDFYNVISIWSNEALNTPLNKDFSKLDANDTHIKNLLSISNIDDNLGERIYKKYTELYPQTKEKPQVYPPTDLNIRALDLEDKFLPMLHGKPTDTLAIMVKDIIAENKLSGKGTIKRNDVSLEIDGYKSLNGKLGVSTHKLLSTAITTFTQCNDTKRPYKQPQHTEINIPLKEYAFMCGFDVEEKKKATPAEQKKEKARAENARKNARKKIRKDLDILYKSSFTWSEKLKGKVEDYAKIRILEHQGIQKGYIKLTFTQTFSEYLVKLPITQYPTALLRVDERNSNAYSMGLQMTEHYNMDNNQVRGTAQLLKVGTLLKYTTLPPIETIKKQRASWELRIKEPFENSLDALTACDLLTDWRYSKSKGEKMTDKEATSFKSFEEWADTLIYFTLKDAPDHTAKLLKNKDSDQE